MGMITMYFDEEKKALEAEFLLKKNFTGFKVANHGVGTVGTQMLQSHGMVAVGPKPDYRLQVLGPESTEQVEAFCTAKGWVFERN